jgi:acyl carrier protein phosphodiesterase
MNYLAHIYLSGDNETVRIGNFMADHIKGNKYKTYPEDIQKGILLHRQIDSFTDNHKIARGSKRRLNERYGLYKGVIIDILYDHFLAKNWSLYSNTPLLDYTTAFYKLLMENYEILPEKIKYMSKYMIKDDWLAAYAHKEGIQKVLSGMNRRTGGISNMDLAINDLEMHYNDFEHDFTLFFKELHDFTIDKLVEINESFKK